VIRLGQRRRRLFESLRRPLLLARPQRRREPIFRQRPWASGEGDAAAEQQQQQQQRLDIQHTVPLHAHSTTRPVSRRPSVKACGPALVSSTCLLAARLDAARMRRAPPTPCRPGLHLARRRRRLALGCWESGPSSVLSSSRASLHPTYRCRRTVSLACPQRPETANSPRAPSSAYGTPPSPQTPTVQRPSRA